MHDRLTSPSRSLDVVSATTVVTASMIGAGVYTTSGYTIASLQSPWLVIAAWTVGGAVAICGAVGYAALASRFTESGGEYLLLGQSLHPVAGLMAGWVSLLAGFTAPIALAAITCESYLQTLFQIDLAGVPRGGLAIGLIVMAALLHTLSVRPSARVQDLIVGLKLVMIAGFIIVASLATGDRWQGWEPLPTSEVFSISAFATSLLYISFSYAGFNAAIYIAGEVRAAERNVPRAMIAGTITVTLLYVALNAVFVLAPSRADIAGQQQVAAIAARAIGGNSFATFVSAVIVVSLFTSVSALVMTGPRVYAKMADDGFLPAWFRFRLRPPTAAIWFQAAAAILVVCVATLQTLLSYLGFTLSLCSALTVAMLFRIRFRGDKVGGRVSLLAASIFVVATCVTAGIAAINEPLQALAAVMTVSLGAILYPFADRSVHKTARSEEPQRDGMRSDEPTRSLD